MLEASGVVFALESDDRENEAVAVVPYRLPKEPDEDLPSWPERAPVDQRELVLLFVLYACPAGFAERFASDAHGFGTSSCSWIDGVVVRSARGPSVRVQRVKNGVATTVRFDARRKGEAAAAWKLLGDAKALAESQRDRSFTGLFYDARLRCEQCVKERRGRVGDFTWDAKAVEKVLDCGHIFRLGGDGAVDDDAVGTLAESLAQMHEKLDIVISKQDRLQTTLEAVALEKHKYPTLFAIEPADEKKEGRFSIFAHLNPLVLLQEELRIVFYCAETLERVDYGGERGLTFWIPKSGAEGALKAAKDFREKYGLAIQVASMSLVNAVNAVTGVDFKPVLDAAAKTASDSLIKGDYVH
mmetsp:Transcript_18330/g.59110  ORF Transcript_18330/g.59110 Transcript_18330/m.59110 type:complete len:356 (-) Transcript_18330:294-1361(-)